MHIRRPQPRAKPQSRRLEWWQLTKRFRKWRQERLSLRIETALERLRFRTWANGLQCIECRAVLALNAKYCQECGAGLPTTEPILPLVSPLPPPPPIVLHPPHPGMLARAYNRVPGGPQTRAMKAVSAVEQQTTGQLRLADYRRKTREQEGQR